MTMDQSRQSRNRFCFSLPDYSETSNEVLGITDNFLYPNKSKIYGKGPRCNETLLQRPNLTVPRPFVIPRFPTSRKTPGRTNIHKTKQRGFSPFTYIDHHGGNFVDVKQLKQLNLMWWNNDPLKSISKSAKQTKKTGKITSPLNHSPYFLKLPKRNGANMIWFSGFLM